MRHNAATIAVAVGLGAIAADARLSERRTRELLERVSRDVEFTPQTAEECAFDAALARAAVRLAVTVQHGKDLSQVDAFIGTGGAIVSTGDPRAVLTAALADPAEPFSLRPRAPRLMLDRHYLLYACGLLASVEPRAALELR
jgi:hypothetical protein